MICNCNKRWERLPASLRIGKSKNAEICCCTSGALPPPKKRTRKAKLLLEDTTFVPTVPREGPEPVTPGTQATAGESGALPTTWELVDSLVGKRAAFWASHRVQESYPRSSVTCEGHKLIPVSCMVSYPVPLSVSTVQSLFSCSWLSF